MRCFKNKTSALVLEILHIFVKPELELSVYNYELRKAGKSM